MKQRELLRERDRFRFGQPGAGFADCANLAAAGQRAFEDARERAEQYAALAGRELGPVARVREAGTSVPGPQEAADARFAMASGPVVDPADQELVAVVEVAWRLLG